MKPFLPLFLVLVPMYGGTIATTSVLFHPSAGALPITISSCSDTAYCLSTGNASVARATAGQEVLSDGQIGYSARAYALADLPYMEANASATLDEWLTFSGNVLYSIVPVSSPYFQEAAVTVDAPKYTGDLSKVSPFANEAWLIQPGVPVHVLVQANAHAWNWTDSSFAILVDPEITLDTPAPEPGTFWLLSAMITAILLHRTRKSPVTCTGPVETTALPESR